MTPPGADRHGIEQTLEAVVARIGDPGPLIYARLFETYPEYRALFVLDGDDSVKGSMLETAYTCLLGCLSGDATTGFILDASRSDHEGYGVAPAEFDRLFEVMRDVFRETLGQDWTADHDTAWNTGLARLRARGDVAV